MWNNPNHFFGSSKDGLYQNQRISGIYYFTMGNFLFWFTVDRYAASFVPTLPRVYIILVLSFGTILVMVADAYVTDSGQGSFWVRLFAWIALISSLLAAAMIDRYDLTFIIIALPVFVLFFLIYGQMGHWVGRRTGVISAGIGLGICLAWALGVSFPIFTLG